MSSIFEAVFKKLLRNHSAAEKTCNAKRDLVTSNTGKKDDYLGKKYTIHEDDPSTKSEILPEDSDIFSDKSCIFVEVLFTFFLK